MAIWLIWFAYHGKKGQFYRDNRLKSSYLFKPNGFHTKIAHDYIVIKWFIYFVFLRTVALLIAIFAFSEKIETESEI